MSRAKIIAASLAAQRKVAGVDVVYDTGEDEIDDLRALVGATRRNQVGNNGFMSKYESRDYIVAAAELALNGEPFEPQEGHKLYETIDGRDLTFEVSPLDGEPCFRYLDPSQTNIRIHTKLVSTGAL